MAPHTVVILGGSYAGLHVAHYLLKNTRKTVKELKVILVSKNSHLYWNVASVRAIVPGAIDDDKMTGSLESALSRYPAEAYELIVGTAEQADFSAKTVRVAVAGGGASRTLRYDTLVLATGSRTAVPGTPWKGVGSHEEVMKLLRETRERVAAAKSIVVAGAGPTGVETAGELAWAFGSSEKDAAKRKEITLLSAGQEILAGDKIAAGARQELAKLGVVVRTGVSVRDTATTAGGKTEIRLEDGEKIVADLYLPTMGLVPNSEYVPGGEFLDEKGLVKVDDTFAVKGAKDVWALGDIVSSPRAAYVHTTMQAAGVSKNLDAVLNGKPAGKAKTMPFDVLICSTGRDRTVGRMGAVKILSIMGWYAKGKTLALDALPTYIDGSCA